MAWTTTSAFSDYILTFTHGDGSVLEGSHRPAKGTARIEPGGIVVPIYNSGTVEDISTTNSTLTPNNSLVTLTQFSKRTAAHFFPFEWVRFADDSAFRKVSAQGQGRDLLGQALTDFYQIIITEGTGTNIGNTTPTGSQLTQVILQKMATIKSRAANGVPSKMTIFLNESGAAAFAFDNRSAFNYAPADDPMFGTFMGADVYTTNDDLSGSGSIMGGIFGEFGIAYASADVQTVSTPGDQVDLRTGMHIITSVHSYGIKSLDSNQLHYFRAAI